MPFSDAQLKIGQFSYANLQGSNGFSYAIPNRVERNTAGFGFLELMFALTIALAIGVTAFQLWTQNQNAFNDQNLVVQAQANTRGTAMQIEQDLTMIGQGVPVYSSTFDTTPIEAVQPILSGSNATAVYFRAGKTNAFTEVATTPNIDLTIGASTSLTVANASLFSNALGTSTPQGRFVYIWGQTSNGWGWVRAQLTSITTATNTISVTPAQTGTSGLDPNGFTRFTKKPTVSLEEGESFYLSGNSVVRGTVTDFTNPTTPEFGATKTIANNITALTFAYYDKNNNLVNPNTLADRATITRVDVQVTTQTARFLSNNIQPTFPGLVRTNPRNLNMR